MEAKLIWETFEKDPDGFPIEEQNHIDIFVEEGSIVRSEFYEAMRSGVDIKLTLETRQEDFELSAHEESGKKSYARKIEYEGFVYDIVRTYKVGKSKIQLICS